MLYGTDVGLSDRLKMALLLGHTLRYQVKKRMAAAGTRFENILLVSERSLPDDALRACCNF